MSLTKEDRYVILAPLTNGTLAGFTGPLEPKANFYTYPARTPQIMKNGVVGDWDTLCKHWKHVYLNELDVASRKGDHPILFLKPKRWNKNEMEQATKLLFEELQIPGLTMVPSAVAALLGTNAVTGLVIEMGKDVTDILPIHDTIPQGYAGRSMLVGSTLFQTDKDLYLEQLFSTLSSSIQALEPSLKSAILENIILANDAVVLREHLNTLMILWMADVNLQDQPREWKLRDIPEYLEAYQGRPELNAYLGASLLAKLIFPDAKSYVSKDEYLQTGPSIIHTKSYGGISV